MALIESFSRYSISRRKHMCGAMRDAGRTCAAAGELNQSCFSVFVCVCVTECMWHGLMTGTESFRAEYALVTAPFVLFTRGFRPSDEVSQTT